jgi:hypothetical protein
MNGIAKTIDNGREALVMVFETTRYGPFNIEGLISYDDGATWEKRHEVSAQNMDTMQGLRKFPPLQTVPWWSPS